MRRTSRSHGLGLPAWSACGSDRDELLSGFLRSGVTTEVPLTRATTSSLGGAGHLVREGPTPVTQGSLLHVRGDPPGVPERLCQRVLS